MEKKLEFSAMGFFLGCFFFFLSFVLLHVHWLGTPFESLLSIIVTIYLGACTWDFSYILKYLLKELDKAEYNPSGPIFFFFKGLLVLLYFVAPGVYIWLKFFEEK